MKPEYIHYHISRRKLAVMKHIAVILAITVACLCLAIPVAYKVGQTNPTEKVAAAIKAEGYDAGRQSVIDEPPSTKELDRHCGAWLMQSNLLTTRTRICGK